jgi:hypothetical protein
MTSKFETLVELTKALITNELFMAIYQNEPDAEIGISNFVGRLYEQLILEANK